MSKNSLYVPKNTANPTLESIVQSVIDTNLVDYVGLASNQTISGTKTFSSQILARSADLTPWAAPAYSFNGQTGMGMYFATDGSTYKNIGFAVDSGYTFLIGRTLPGGDYYYVYYDLFNSAIAAIDTNGLTLYNGRNLYMDNTTIQESATAARTITLPDITGTVALLEGTQTFSGAKTFSSNINLTLGTHIVFLNSDGITTTTIAGSDVATKNAFFKLPGYTDFNTTSYLVGQSTTQTLTNKDLSSATNTFPSSLATLTGTQSISNKTITASKFGTNGTNISDFRYGRIPYSTTLAAGATTDAATITFSPPFSSAPNIQCNIVQLSGGALWDQCRVQGKTSSPTTTLTFRLANPNASSATGNMEIHWRAMN